MRGILAGALTLIALHTIVAYAPASGRLEGLVGADGVLVTGVRRFLSPDVPAIRDRLSGQHVGAPAASPPPPKTDHTTD
jgi:hypothetical protein